MKIAAFYSHLNGYEFIKVHKPHLWDEICEVVEAVDAETHRTKSSREKTMAGQMLYSPASMNAAIREGFSKHDWTERKVSYWVTGDAKLIRKTLALPPDEQRSLILEEGAEAVRSFNQTDFVKDRVAVEVQFGKYFSVAYDLFVKHLAFYVGDVIDVGVEIVPMRSLSAPSLREDGTRSRNMSTGVPWYEKELYNLIREGRGVPGVPLVLIGVAP